jgi:hypothetical protein
MPAEHTINDERRDETNAERFAYGGSQAASLTSGAWRVAAASVTGPSHVKRGVGCDDAAAAACVGSSLLVVVCDGAGSSQFGGRGAETAARLIAERMAASGGEASTIEPDADVVRTALTEVRATILADAEREGVKPSAFATTVVGAWLGASSSLLFHLGDGVAIAFGPNNEVLAVSRGRFAEYANETYFLTDETWEESLLFEPVSDAIESLFLMTDGVTPFAMDLNTPKASFHEGVLAYLRRHGPEKGAAAIQRLLDKDDARSKVSDDKTLLWAQRAEAAPEKPDVTVESTAELAR